MVKYVPKAQGDRVYDPKDPYRFSYERITPEAEAEFYRRIGDGPWHSPARRGFPPGAAGTTPPAVQTPPPAKPRPARKRPEKP